MIIKSTEVYSNKNGREKRKFFLKIIFIAFTFYNSKKFFLKIGRAHV